MALIVYKDNSAIIFCKLWSLISQFPVNQVSLAFLCMTIAWKARPQTHDSEVDEWQQMYQWRTVGRCTEGQYPPPQKKKKGEKTATQLDNVWVVYDSFLGVGARPSPLLLIQVHNAYIMCDIFPPNVGGGGGGELAPPPLKRKLC